MGKLIFKIAVVYLVILASVFLGMLVQMRYGMAERVSETLQILKENAEYEISDLKDGVRRFLVSSSSSSLMDPSDYSDLFVPDAEILFKKTGGNAYKGGFILQGTFNYAGKNDHMALLLRNDGQILNTWVLSEEVDGAPRPHPKSNKFPHGLELFDDGSILYSFDVGVSLTKQSYCGQTQWTRHDFYHHSVSKVDQSKAYAVVQFRGENSALVDGFHLVDVTDGALLKSFTVLDIMKANPDIDPLGIRQQDENTRSIWEDDPFHTNDIEALPPELAGHYPEFAEGDLLISLRSVNLVMVVSPEDLKIKWFRQGYTRRQHDPDWTADGISVYDNRMHLGRSEIVMFKTDQMRPEKIIADTKYDFYSSIRGKHDRDANDNILVTSPQQGRVFGVDSSGEVFVEILNLADGAFDKRLTISEADFVRPELMDALEELKCE